MSHLLDDDDDLPRHRGDRELTLSTGAILGIFFGLALICGFFFAFGYNMGHKASPALAATTSDASDNYTSASAAYSSSKPSAGSPLGQSTSSPVATDSASNAGGTPPHTASVSKPDTTSATAVRESTAENATAKPTPSAVHTSPSFAGGNFVVQVAAVSHQEDAELLVSSLQKKGYSVAARNEPGDKLVHIQVGPFADHKEADTMKQRLQGDGYNAMIKQL